MNKTEVYNNLDLDINSTYTHYNWYVYVLYPEVMTTARGGASLGTGGGVVIPGGVISHDPLSPFPGEGGGLSVDFFLSVFSRFPLLVQSSNMYDSLMILIIRERLEGWKSIMLDLDVSRVRHTHQDPHRSEGGAQPFRQDIYLYFNVINFKLHI